MVTYVMKTCGCSLTKEQLNITLTPKGKIRTRLCPVHNTPVAYRLTFCSACGIYFKHNRSGILSKYCPECRKKHHLKIIRENYLKRKNKF